MALLSPIIGVPVNPGWVVASIKSGNVIFGNGVATVIVCGPPGGMLKLMAVVFSPKFASSMAARSEQSPLTSAHSLSSEFASGVSLVSVDDEGLYIAGRLETRARGAGFFRDWSETATALKVRTEGRVIRPKANSVIAPTKYLFIVILLFIPCGNPSPLIFDRCL